MVWEHGWTARHHVRQLHRYGVYVTRADARPCWVGVFERVQEEDYKALYK